MRDKISLEARQIAIKELITTQQVSDQNQLVGFLKKHHRIATNQAVVSRDLRKMGIVKKLVNGVLTYEIPESDVRAEILRLALVDITHNETMIVITTHPGLADFVGDCLDQHDDLGLLGCLSGENVVFAVPESIKKIDKTCRAIREKFHFKKGEKH